MAAALPLAKLLALLIKTLSKPLSKSLKSSAASHPSLQSTLQLIGQTSHQITARLSIWSNGFKVKNIGSLNPEKALQKGSDIFGETIVLSVASTIVVFEYTSSSAKNKAKEEKKMKEMEAVDIELQTKLRVLDKRVQVLESRIRILGAVGGVKEEDVRREVIEERKKIKVEKEGKAEKKVEEEKVEEKEGKFTKNEIGWLRKNWLFGYNLKWLDLGSNQDNATKEDNKENEDVSVKTSTVDKEKLTRKI